MIIGIKDMKTISIVTWLCKPGHACWFQCWITCRLYLSLESPNSAWKTKRKINRSSNRCCVMGTRKIESCLWPRDLDKQGISRNSGKSRKNCCSSFTGIRETMDYVKGQVPLAFKAIQNHSSKSWYHRYFRWIPWYWLCRKRHKPYLHNL